MADAKRVLVEAPLFRVEVVGELLARADVAVKGGQFSLNTHNGNFGY